MSMVIIYLGSNINLNHAGYIFINCFSFLVCLCEEELLFVAMLTGPRINAHSYSILQRRKINSIYTILHKIEQFIFVILNPYLG
jgi:hypothetical protein